MVRVDGKWQLLEMCEPLHGLQDQEEPLENVAENALIFLDHLDEGSHGDGGHGLRG